MFLSFAPLSGGRNSTSNAYEILICLQMNIDLHNAIHVITTVLVDEWFMCSGVGMTFGVATRRNNSPYTISHQRSIILKYKINYRIFFSLKNFDGCFCVWNRNKYNVEKVEEKDIKVFNRTCVQLSTMRTRSQKSDTAAAAVFNVDNTHSCT